MTDEMLWQCNETELLWLARRQGIGHLKRGIPKQELVSIVGGYIEPGPHHFAETVVTRKMLEAFIQKHWGKVASQLPQCTGKCTTFNCTEGKHGTCFYPNRELVQT